MVCNAMHMLAQYSKPPDTHDAIFLQAQSAIPTGDFTPMLAYLAMLQHLHMPVTISDRQGYLLSLIFSGKRHWLPSLCCVAALFLHIFSLTMLISRYLH